MQGMYHNRYIVPLHISHSVYIPIFILHRIDILYFSRFPFGITSLVILWWCSGTALLPAELIKSSRVILDQREQRLSLGDQRVGPEGTQPPSIDPFVGSAGGSSRPASKK